MKEYGIDLKKEYEELEIKQLALFRKIKKRRAFLIKNASREVLRNANRDITAVLSSDSITMYLDDIIAIEKAYTDQSEQLDIFKE